MIRSAHPTGSDEHFRASSCLSSALGPCGSRWRTLMSEENNDILDRNAVNGSPGRAFDLFGRTYCHCAVPTGEHSRTMDISASQVNSLAGEPSWICCQASRIAMRLLSVSTGKHFSRSFGLPCMFTGWDCARTNTEFAKSANAGMPDRHRSLDFATRATNGWASTPIESKPARSPSIMVVPEPANGSRTRRRPFAFSRSRISRAQVAENPAE